MLSSKYNEITRLDQLRKKVDLLEEQLKKKDDKSKELKMVLARMEQYSRHTNTEIHGVSKVDNKDLMDILEGLSIKQLSRTNC